MKTLILQFVILGLATAALANDEKYVLITTNQAAEVKQKLEAYENGRLKLQDLNEKSSAEESRELIGYYLLNSNNISIKAKLPISRCYIAGYMYPEGARLAAEYLLVYSNDSRGWKALGGASCGSGNFDVAVRAYTNAVNLGDKGVFVPLAGAALGAHKLDIVRDMIPQLLDLRSSVQITKSRKYDIVMILVTYSLRTDDKDIFIKTLSGINLKEAVSRDDIRQDIALGFEQFKGAEIDKIRDEMKSVSSSTNSVSNPPR